MAVWLLKTLFDGTRKHSVFFALVVFATVMGLPYEARAAEPIKISIYVDDNYRPFSYQQDGVAQGLYIQVLNQAFSRMEGFDVTIVPVAWDRGKLMVKNGKAIGLAPAFYHGHDWPYMYPYSQPFYTETIRVYCLEDLLSGESREWPSGFEGLRIGNVKGFEGWGGKAFYEMVDEGRIQYKEASGTKQLIQQAAKGWHDCILMEESAFNFLIKTVPDGEASKKLLAGPVTGRDPVYIGYSKNGWNDGTFPYLMDFMQSFDNEIYQMKKTGTIDELLSGTPSKN